MTISELAIEISEAFRDPPKTELILLTESTVTWIRSSDSPVCIEVSGEKSGLTDALADVFKEVSKSSPRSRCFVAIGGGFSVTKCSKPTEPLTLDKEIDNGASADSSLSSVWKSEWAPEYVFQGAIARHAVSSIARGASDHSVPVIGVCTIEALTVLNIQQKLSNETCTNIEWPNQSLFIRGTSRGIELVSETTSSKSSERSSLSTLVDQNISLSRITLSNRNYESLGSAWASRISWLSGASDRIRFERVTPRLTRIAAALIITLGGLGIWQSRALGDSELQRTELHRLVEARQELMTQQSEYIERSANSEVLSGLTTTSFLGRLGQERPAGIRLTSARTSSNSKSNSVTVSGQAEDENQVFHYIETLRTHFPATNISLDNITTRHVNSRRNESSITSFTLVFER